MYRSGCVRRDTTGDRLAIEPARRPTIRALSEVAGILEGTSEGELNEPIARQSAWLCRQAGADPEAIPGWIEEGRRRKANASRPPFSDPHYRRPGRQTGM